MAPRKDTNDGKQCEEISHLFLAVIMTRWYPICTTNMCLHASIRSRPGKPNQRKGQNKKFMNFAHFCEFWCFSLGKQARFTLNFCSGMPLRKVHELAFLWFGLPGPLLILGMKKWDRIDLIKRGYSSSVTREHFALPCVSRCTSHVHHDAFVGLSGKQLSKCKKHCSPEKPSWELMIRAITVLWPFCGPGRIVLLSLRTVGWVSMDKYQLRFHENIPREIIRLVSRLQPLQL